MLNPDKVFYIKECGRNAIDAIYSLYEGSIFNDFVPVTNDLGICLLGISQDEVTEPLDTWKLGEWYNAKVGK